MTHRSLAPDELMCLAQLALSESGAAEHKRGMSLGQLEESLRTAYGYSYAIARCDAELRGFKLIEIPRDDRGRPRGSKVRVTSLGASYVSNPANWQSCLRDVAPRIKAMKDDDERTQTEDAIAVLAILCSELFDDDQAGQIAKAAPTTRTKRAKKEQAEADAPN